MYRFLILTGFFVSFAGCGIQGNNTVYQARPAYNEAIARTSTEQLLLNLVRMKFRDAPVFLQVGSIATQYTFSETAGINPTFSGGDTNLLGTLSVLRTEQPTITFTPLQGEQFAKQLMGNISIETLALLSSSGWSIERILRCCVQSINGVPNAPTAAGPTPENAPEFKEFYRLSQLFRVLQERGDLQFKTSKIPGESARMDILSGNGNREILNEIKSILKKGEAGKSYSLANSKFPLKSTSANAPMSIQIVPRSLYATLFYLGQGVQTSLQVVDAGLVTMTQDQSGNKFDWSDLTKHLMTIQSSDTPPSNSYVSVFYRNAFYYIADNDLSSKATLMLLDQLFSLQSGMTNAAPTPALTLAVGH